jgi:ATP-dependent RNA helicase DDX56/DBP9
MSYFLDDEKTWMQRDFGLDRRLVKALSKLGFTYPTLVQAKCIPIVLQGKDVLVRAKTGSGKTIAFSLPILQKILSTKDSQGSNTQSIKCIVLAPTKELIKQIEKHMTDLIYYCRESLTICSLADDNVSVQKFRLQSKPDIVISTPARFVQNMKAFEIDLSGVTTLVMDEADLVLSFGYTEDVHSIISHMPKIFQGILMSATLSADLDKFKRVVLHNPALLKLEEPEGASNLMQFYLKCTEKDKFLVLYVFIKLGLLQVRFSDACSVFCLTLVFRLSLLQGKGLIFVNDVNKCYKLKLFFQQFFINTAVLNAEVPLNSRLHILEVSM